MEYLGLFCLGVFVGVIAIVGLALIKNLTDWKQVLVVILPAVLSGAAMVLVDRFKYSPALGCYPLGLAVALMWAYIGAAVENINASDMTRKAIGWAHAGAAVLVTVASVLLVTLPAVSHVKAEVAISQVDRVKELQEARRRTVAIQRRDDAASAPKATASSAAGPSSASEAAQSSTAASAGN